MGFFWRTISLTTYLLILIYLIIPSLIYFLPGVMQHAFFLNFVRIPFQNFDNFTRHKIVSKGRNFYLTHDDDIKLGAWHILPKSLSEIVGEKQLSDSEFEKLLANENYPIILYLHGNSFDRAGDHRCRLYNVLASLDFHIVTVDYRGYGDSSGWPTETGIVSDGKLAFNYVLEKAGANPVYVWGHSMGTGVATKVVMDMCGVGVAPIGLILESPFNNLKDVVLNHPLSLPFRWIPWFDHIFLHPMQRSGIDMSTDERILKVTCPILILHAHDDHIIPCALAQRLTEAARKGRRDVTFVDFAKERRFGHKHIFRAHELPNIIRDFVARCTTCDGDADQC